jgi:hypothetical protein
MAWFALSLHAPTWWPSTPETSQICARTSCKETLFALQTPTRQADVYTLRICGRDARPDLLSRLRSAVTDMGGTVVVDVVEGRGFMCVCSTILEYAY